MGGGVSGIAGKHVVILGGGGIGTALAYSLQDAGAVVSVGDCNEARLDELRQCGVYAFPVDVADADDVEESLQCVCDRTGSLWGLCVTAAIVHRGHDIIETAPKQFRQIMDINFFGTLHANQVAARMMIANAVGGRIINWSSVNAVGGTSGGAAYASSNAAVEPLSMSLAV